MKDVGGIPIVLSRGTPYEIGYNHGKSHPDKVRKSFEHNLVSCLKSGYVSKEEVYRIAGGYIKNVEAYNKDYIEDIVAETGLQPEKHQRKADFRSSGSGAGSLYIDSSHWGENR